MISLATNCRRRIWICLVTIRKVRWSLRLWELIFEDFSLDQAEGAAGSELMTYQPSPYNNNLDLNELLDVADMDAVKNSQWKNSFNLLHTSMFFSLQIKLFLRRIEWFLWWLFCILS